MSREGTLKLVNDQRDHAVEVLFGSCAVERNPKRSA
jgi:hypothetical protein